MKTFNMATKSSHEKCLLCDSTNELKRGLCSSHYQKYKRAWRSVPEAKRADFEAELIEDGLLLPPQKRGRKSEDLVFKEKAAKYLVTEARKKGKKTSGKSSKRAKPVAKKKPKRKRQ